MAKPEWGTKRVCRSCGARFYDMCRKIVTCPKCGSVYEPEPPPKARRSATPLTAPVVKPAPKVAPVLAAVAAEPGDATAKAEGDDDALGDIETDAADKGGDIIEDPSELGEDEDDMAEVIDGSRKDDDDR